MNMNKALQNLYHAVSGSTTTKVNISKLLVDIHYAITGVESSVKNNWSRIIDSMATNWPEGGGGGGSSDFIVVLQTINITAQSVTGVYNSDYQVYECIAEIASASAEALADYSYGDLTYNKLLKSGDEVGTFNGVELDRTGFPEDVTSASMHLEGDKWVAWIECVSPFTVTLNPQTIIAYRATEEVADYFGNMSVCY